MAVSGEEADTATNAVRSQTHPVGIIDGIFFQTRQRMMRRKDMKYVEQNPEDCTYSVFLGFDAEQFSSATLLIVKSAKIELHGFFIETAIIGESHFVSVARGTHRLFVDMLACINLAQHGLRPTYAKKLGITYTITTAKKFRTTNQEKWTVHGTVTQVKKKTVLPALILDSIQLMQIFPGPLAPETRLSMSIQPDIITIDTIHEFAVHGAIHSLISHSTYQTKGG